MAQHRRDLDSRLVGAYSGYIGLSDCNLHRAQLTLTQAGQKLSRANRVGDGVSAPKPVHGATRQF